MIDLSLVCICVSLARARDRALSLLLSRALTLSLYACVYMCVCVRVCLFVCILDPAPHVGLFVLSRRLCLYFETLSSSSSSSSSSFFSFLIMKGLFSCRKYGRRAFKKAENTVHYWNNEEWHDISARNPHHPIPQYHALCQKGDDTSTTGGSTSASCERSACEEYGPGKPDDDCCAIKNHTSCKDGYELSFTTENYGGLGSCYKAHGHTCCTAITSTTLTTTPTVTSSHTGKAANETTFVGNNSNVSSNDSNSNSNSNRNRNSSSNSNSSNDDDGGAGQQKSSTSSSGTIAAVVVVAVILASAAAVAVYRFKCKDRDPAALAPTGRRARAASRVASRAASQRPSPRHPTARRASRPRAATVQNPTFDPESTAGGSSAADSAYVEPSSEQLQAYDENAYV